MRTVDDFARIRQLHREGLSARQIAKQLAVGRDTVRKAIAQPDPKPCTLAQPRSASVFGPVHEVVDRILAADETAPRKQRHTACRSTAAATPAATIHIDHFWSGHHGGGNWLFADGSVRFVAYAASPVMQSLATREDGEVASPEGYYKPLVRYRSFAGRFRDPRSTWCPEKNRFDPDLR